MQHREEALALLGAYTRLPRQRQAYLTSCAQTLAGLEPDWLRTPESRPQRRDLRLGDRVLVYPCFGGLPEPQLGTVCYIHPRRRYYTVALDRGCTQAFHWGTAD